MNNVFISGVSSGIGLALANLYINKGWNVFGISRRAPDELIENERFFFKSCDLNLLEDANCLFDDTFQTIVKNGVSVVYLNAGTSGNVPKLAKEYSLEDIYRTLAVNAISNKILLDAFLSLPNKPEVVVASASIAGLRFRAGMLPYSLSKSALLALCGVYAQEYPDVFFAVIGMCNVDTSLSRDIVYSPRVRNFPNHLLLQDRFNTPGYVVSSETRAKNLFDIIHKKRNELLQSGHFIEVRDILNIKLIN